MVEMGVGIWIWGLPFEVVGHAICVMAGLILVRGQPVLHRVMALRWFASRVPWLLVERQVHDDYDFSFCILDRASSLGLACGLMHLTWLSMSFDTSCR